jgi:hypothetical protein
MMAKFIQSVSLLLLTFLALACNGPAKRFQILERKLSAAETQRLDDFSPDSLLQSALINSQVLKKDIEVLLTEIKESQSNLPYYQLDQRLSTYLQQLEKLQQDASTYNLGGHLKVALSQKNKTLQEKLITCDSLLDLAPLYYASAQQKINQAIPERLSLAIRKQALGIYLLNNELQDSLAELNWTAEERQLWQERTTRAQRSMKDYIAWCNSRLIDYHAIENSISQ